MATGSPDTNGIWKYGEDDNIALVSDLLNLGTTSTSTAFTADRARLATVEAGLETSTTFVAASATARDAKWGAPTTVAARVLLQNKGARTIRTDLGIIEQYFAVYNSSTNPGGRTTAGWYTNTRETGLVPIYATTVTVAGGTGVKDAMGNVSFTTATSIRLDGLFTATYQNYRVVIPYQHTGTSGQIAARMATAGTITSDLNYTRQGFAVSNAATAPAAWYGAAEVNLGLGYSGNIAGVNNQLLTIDISSPQANGRTTFQWVSNGLATTYATVSAAGYYNTSASHDGLYLNVTAGTITGTIFAYGYNN